ncbi:MAG: hypothetical protein ACLT1W_06830 [Alistipes onderdonkii]
MPPTKFWIRPSRPAPVPCEARLQPTAPTRLPGKLDSLSPESAETFSAIGFLGRMLHQQEKVPVGMIVCAWGGSEAKHG